MKERFAIAPEDVPSLLKSEYDVTKNASQYTLKELTLVDEVQRLIGAKRLVPTVRSQCHRTAFQLNHTNAVRASIDTNLCLISEVLKDDDLETKELEGAPRWCEPRAQGVPNVQGP